MCLCYLSAICNCSVATVHKVLGKLPAYMSIMHPISTHPWLNSSKIVVSGICKHITHMYCTHMDGDMHTNMHMHTHTHAHQHTQAHNIHTHLYALSLAYIFTKS